MKLQPGSVFPFRVADGAAVEIGCHHADPIVTLEVFEGDQRVKVQVPRATAIVMAQAILQMATSSDTDPRSGLVEWAVPQDDLNPPSMEVYTDRQPAAIDANLYNVPLYRVMWARDPVTPDQPDEH